MVPVTRSKLLTRTIHDKIHRDPTTTAASSALWVVRALVGMQAIKCSMASSAR